MPRKGKLAPSCSSRILTGFAGRIEAKLCENLSSRADAVQEILGNKLDRDKRVNMTTKFIYISISLGLSLLVSSGTATLDGKEARNDPCLLRSRITGREVDSLSSQVMGRVIRGCALSSIASTAKKTHSIVPSRATFSLSDILLRRHSARTGVKKVGIVSLCGPMPCASRQRQRGWDLFSCLVFNARQSYACLWDTQYTTAHADHSTGGAAVCLTKGFQS